MYSSNVHAIYSYILETLYTINQFVQFTKIINDQQIRNFTYYDLLWQFENQPANIEALTLSIIDQRSLNRLLGTGIYGWRWSKKRCHRRWCKDQDREFTASSSSCERQGVRGTLGERSKERETIRYQVGCEAWTRGGRARKKRLGRRGNDLCHSLVATPAPAADQRPALALNSGQAVDTSRAGCWNGDERKRKRERTACTRHWKKVRSRFAKGDDRDYSGTGHRGQSFLTLNEGRRFCTNDSSRTRVRWSCLLRE